MCHYHLYLLTYSVSTDHFWYVITFIKLIAFQSEKTQNESFPLEFTSVFSLYMNIAPIQCRAVSVCLGDLRKMLYGGPYFVKL